MKRGVNMYQSMKTLGEIVRETRKSKKMSQEMLAEKLGVCKRTIIDVEKNTANPKFELLYVLVRELDLPLDEIFYQDLTEDLDLKEKLLQELNNCSRREIQFILTIVKGLRKVWDEEEK